MEYFQQISKSDLRNIFTRDLGVVWAKEVAHRRCSRGRCERDVLVVRWLLGVFAHGYLLKISGDINKIH